MTKVICIGDTDERTRAVAACLRRLSSDEGPPEGRGDELQERLNQLRLSGRLSSAGTDETGRKSINYHPSTESKRALFEADVTPNWPRRVERYMSQDVQRVPGAVFRFPVYERDTVVEAFITDWSPFPAACAIAIHPSHFLADGCNNEPNCWTGGYARHVLTGDLLAIWTADWVRPEFGTGSVIVNPAHSDIDLAFARAVGLPVRFGLAPEPPSSDPESWLAPPIVNTGYAVRTGIADGETAESARRIYLELLQTAGHAFTYTDRVLPPLLVGSVTALQGLADLQSRLMVTQVVEQPVTPQDVLVVSATDMPELIAARALHIEVHGSDMDSPRVLLVQPAAAGATGEEGSRERDLALIGGGRLDEVLALKAQQIEQAARFYENHEKLSPPEDVDLAVKPPKRVARILVSAREGQMAAAFTDLYKLQRDLRQKPESVGAGDRYAYFAAAYAFGNTTVPNGYAVADVLGAGA